MSVKINKDAFITGVTDIYPSDLLKGRIEIEGNVVSCFFKDMLLVDEVGVKKEDFITKDGRFYYSLLKALRRKKYSSLDEITIMSSFDEKIINAYEERGGWETIQHQINIINDTNFQTYIDTMYRENVILKMYDDGFNLTKKIEIFDKEKQETKKIEPIRLFRKMTAEEVIDWYEARMSDYGTGYSSKVLEEEEIDFDDDFFESLMEGEENGVPFETVGQDIDGNDINGFQFLSRQICGLKEGTFSMIAGYSSTGKSTWIIPVLLALVTQGRKVLVITNEEDVSRFKIKLIVWFLANKYHYYKLNKKNLSSGNLTEENKEMYDLFKQDWKAEFAKKFKIISIEDSNVPLAKKKIRENVLKYGYDTVFYDTFKMQEGDFNASRQDLALVKDSREFHKMAKKYSIIMLASLQLAEHTKGKLFLDATTLSNSKQIKEILENLFLLRNVYKEELDPKSKYFCKPFRITKNKDGKWIEKDYPTDEKNTYKVLFVEKARMGENSSDSGKAYLLRFNGDYASFYENSQCKPTHGQIV